MYLKVMCKHRRSLFIHPNMPCVPPFSAFSYLIIVVTHAFRAKRYIPNMWQILEKDEKPPDPT